MLDSAFGVSFNFYPRPPRGGRHWHGGKTRALRRFLSTPSARRATWFMASFEPPLLFLSTPSARRATSIPGLVDHH